MARRYLTYLDGTLMKMMIKREKTHKGHKRAERNVLTIGVIMKTEESKKCGVCNYEYQMSQDIMDFDSALKNIHWALVVPSVVLILFIPYGTYLICRQAEKHEALEDYSTLIKSSAVIICLLIGKNFRTIVFRPLVRVTV